MKRKIVWGKVEHLGYFLVKTSLKFVSSKNKIGVSLCPVYHIAPFSSAPERSTVANTSILNSQRKNHFGCEQQDYMRNLHKTSVRGTR
jgi:hypothetical protein